MRYLEAAVHSARAAWPGPRDHGSHGIGNRVPYGMRLHDVKVKMCADVGPTAPAIGISLKILPAPWEATLADCMHRRAV